MSGPRGPDRRELLIATSAAGAMLTTPGLGLAAEAQHAFGPGRAQTFDLGWRFHLGEGDGREAPDLDDGGWRALDLPHDWSIEDVTPAPGQAPADVLGPFDRAAVGKAATG